MGLAKLIAGFTLRFRFARWGMYACVLLCLQFGSIGKHRSSWEITSHGGKTKQTPSLQFRFGQFVRSSEQSVECECSGNPDKEINANMYFKDSPL